MGSCYPWGSFVYLATFFHRSLYFIRFRISVVTKELGAHKVWLSFKEYACLLHHWIIDWNYAFSLSLGLSKTFRTHRLRYLRNISIELIWPAIFEASCCAVWRIWDRDYLLSTDCFTKDNPAGIVCEIWIQTCQSFKLILTLILFVYIFLWLDALKRMEIVILWKTCKIAWAKCFSHVKQGHPTRI